MTASVTNIQDVRHCKQYFNIYMLPIVVMLIFDLMGYCCLESGVDYDNYSNYFDLVSTYDFYDILSNRIEPLFGLLTFIFTSIFASNFLVYICFIVISVFLKVFVLSAFQQNRLNFILLVVFYLFRYFPLYELTQIRVSVAIGLVIFAFKLPGTKFKWIFFLLACLTHYSVLVLLPLLFLVNFARRSGGKYEINEKLIWLSIFVCTAVIGLTSQIILQYITPYFVVLQLYDIKSFGEESVSLFNATILVDIVGIISAYALQRHMSVLTRLWIHIQALGVLCFYLLIDLPIMAFRIRELFCVFWIFYVSDALKQEGIVRFHAISFILSCVISYFYFYFLGKSAIFPI